MDPDGTQLIFIFLLFLALSIFFSLSKASIFSLSKIRLDAMIEEGVKNISVIEKISINKTKLLLTASICCNLCKIVASITALYFFITSGSVASLLFFILAVLVIIVLDVITNCFGTSKAENITIFVAKPMLLFMWLCTPLIVVLDFILRKIIKFMGTKKNKNSSLSNDDAVLKSIMEVIKAEGNLKDDEKKIIDNLVDLQSVNAKDIMTPRTDIISVPFNMSYDDVMEVFRVERFTRMPIHKESTDEIIGMLHLKDISFIKDTNNFSIESYMREAFYTYENKPVSELFKTLKNEHISMAIVLDEYGGTSGIVTMEDIIEEILGDIFDEYDESALEIQIVKEDEYIVDGRVRLDYFNEMVGAKLESEDYESVGGYVIGALDRIPKLGDTVECDGIKFFIEQVNKNRVVKIRVLT